MSDLTGDELDELYNAIFNRPAKGPGARAACGTPGGYYRHRNDGEEPCEACRDANTEAKRNSFNSPVRRPSQLKPIAHGTAKGYKQHRYRREQACEACLAAQRANNTERYASRRQNGGAQ